MRTRQLTIVVVCVFIGITALLVSRRAIWGQSVRSSSSANEDSFGVETEPQSRAESRTIQPGTLHPARVRADADSARSADAERPRSSRSQPRDEQQDGGRAVAPRRPDPTLAAAEARLAAMERALAARQEMIEDLGNERVEIMQEAVKAILKAKQEAMEAIFEAKEESLKVMVAAREETMELKLQLVKAETLLEAKEELSQAHLQIANREAKLAEWETRAKAESEMNSIRLDAEQAVQSAEREADELRERIEELERELEELRERLNDEEQPR